MAIAILVDSITRNFRGAVINIGIIGLTICFIGIAITVSIFRALSVLVNVGLYACEIEVTLEVTNSVDGCVDADNDGSCGNAAVNPDAVEECSDGIDNN